MQAYYYSKLHQNCIKLNYMILGEDPKHALHGGSGTLHGTSLRPEVAMGRPSAHLEFGGAKVPRWLLNGDPSSQNTSIFEGQSAETPRRRIGDARGTRGNFARQNEFLSISK